MIGYEDAVDFCTVGSPNCKWYGTQSYTCNQCVNHFCHDDACNNGEGSLIEYCNKCEKAYCHRCVEINECGNCSDSYCNKCIEMKECEEEACDNTFCENCAQQLKCFICNNSICGECDTERYDCDRSGCNRSVCARCAKDEPYNKDPWEGDQTLNGGGGCEVCGIEFCSRVCRNHIQDSREASRQAMCWKCTNMRIPPPKFDGFNF